MKEKTKFWKKRELETQKVNKADRNQIRCQDNCNTKIRILYRERQRRSIDFARLHLTT